MNVVMIIPTGIGCKIGGHCGDATPAAKLLASCCDKLLIHPNVVNASDLNEMPDNCLYIEGSILNRFLQGGIYLQEVYSNHVLVVINPIDESDPVSVKGMTDAVNAVSAARATMGLSAEIVELAYPLRLIAKMEDGIATGDVFGWRELVAQVAEYDFDALAIATKITVSDEVMIDYYREGGVNPVGGVEALASKLIAGALNKPVAHGPVEYSLENFSKILSPAIAVEAVTDNFIHCILKGLHKAPRLNIEHGMHVDEIDYLVSPFGCWGVPHKACVQRGIPIIVVEDNDTVCHDKYPEGAKLIFVKNYLEAVGYLKAVQTGVDPLTVSRPLSYTSVYRAKRVKVD